MIKRREPIFSGIFPLKIKANFLPRVLLGVGLVAFMISHHNEEQHRNSVSMHDPSRHPATPGYPKKAHHAKQ